VVRQKVYIFWLHLPLFGCSSWANILVSLKQPEKWDEKEGKMRSHTQATWAENGGAYLSFLSIKQLRVLLYIVPVMLPSQPQQLSRTEKYVQKHILPIVSIGFNETYNHTKLERDDNDGITLRIVHGTQRHGSSCSSVQLNISRVNAVKG